MGFLSSLFGFGSSKAQPATQTVVQSQKLPPEIAPFVEEIAGEAQDLFKQRAREGYVPFTGETIAPFTPQEETAMAGIEGLVGTSRPLQEEALGVTRGLAEKFTPEKAKEYMSPYQKAVTDIEQREAQTRFEREIRPRFEASAVQAGGMSGLGTRAGVEAAELQRGQSQLLADIETRGLQSAFQDAQNQFAQQKQREGQMASEIGRAGPAMLASGLQEAGALQSVGAEKRGLDQSTLDEAYFKFLEGQRHPEQTLAEYSGFIYGNPLTQMGTTSKTGTSTPYQPSLGQSLLSLGSTLGSAALRGGMKFGSGGGYIDRDRGLSGLPMFRRKENGQVVDEEGEESVEFIQTIKDWLGPLSESLDRQKAESSERFKLGMKAAPHQRQRLWDIFTKTKSDPESIATKEALTQARKAQTGFEQGLVKAREDADLLETATERAGESEGLPGDFQEGAVEEVDDVEINLSTKTAEDKSNKKKIMKDIANRPSEGKLVSMTEAEAGAKYDANPAAFGDMTREQYLKDTADYNKRYMDTIKRIYPEGQNEILADALQALGAMFVAENKGEAFTKTFNDLQKAGMKRRDARRIALGKAGLENLKSDKATLDKIRQLPKQRRDAINEMIEIRAKQMERRDISELREATTGLRKAEKGKAERYRPKIEKAVKLSDGERKSALSYSTTTLMPTLLNKIKDDKTGVAGRMKNIISSNSTTADDIADEVEATFEHKAFPSILNKELESLRNEKKGLSSSELYNQAALRALKYFKTEKSWIGTDNIVLR